MNEVERLFERLKGMKNFNIFPGSNPNATAEEVAAEVNKALDQIAKGDCRT